MLAAGAYRAFVADSALAPLVKSFAGVGAGDAATTTVTDRLADARRVIGGTPVPADVVAALGAALRETGLADATVAVRSSATAEDGHTASFAGAHASMLDVPGRVDDVVHAVRQVYASLWTPAALAYRRRQRLGDDDVACAVVVCRMVDARAAGVAFTCDPLTGRRDVVAISAVPGRGDAVVSGVATTEDVTVAVTRTGLAVESRRGPHVLDVGRVFTLSRLAFRVAAALGDEQDPQDVEWAWDGDRFHLLQARPVTRVPRVAFSGSEHLPVVWSTANIKDAVPFVQTALAWSLLMPALRSMMWAFPAKVGYPVPRGLEVVRRFAGRGYFDVTSFQWVFYDCFGALPAETNRGMGGHHAEIPVPDTRPLRGRQGWPRIHRRLRGARVLMTLPKTISPQIERVFAQTRELLAVDPAALSKAGLIALFERITRVQLAYGEPFILSTSALAWQSELEMVLERIAPGRGIALASALVAGGGDVVSAAHGTRLFDVADAARQDPAALAWLRGEPRDPLGFRALPAASPFRREFERFLGEFGHRAVYEAELATPRWNEDPSWLLDQVVAILDGLGRRPVDAARRRRADAEAEVRERTWLRRPHVWWLARRAREGAALRERAKSALCAQIGPVRRVVLDVGRRLVAEGRLAAPDDVFHLAWSEVAAWLHDEWDGHGMLALVEDRKAQKAAWEQERPPDVIQGDAPVVPARAAPVVATGPVLRGLAVSSGRAAGRARVVRHPAEGALLRQDEILVAPSTDPGWTPLFLRASAIVMEVGGMLSHGAIVAREYGLPAVVNIPGLLDLVKDGDELVVDGDAGTVERISSAG